MEDEKYQKTIWENKKTPINAENLNKIENELEKLDNSKLEYEVVEEW